MKNIKFIFAGIFTLAIGVALGWFFKPSVYVPAEQTDHVHGEATTPSSGEIWTCSMHPQIRQAESGLCPICEMDLIPLDMDMSSSDPTILKMTESAAKLAQVETTIVGEPALAGGMNSASNKVIKVDGTVELDERSINSQASHIAGRLQALLVNFEGDYVKTGQKIATVYSTELLAASQELLTAAKLEDKVEGIKDASIQKLKNWKLSDAQIQDILNSGKPIETVDIFADHSGYVLQKKVSQGDYVKQGQALFTVGRTGSLWLLFNVFESDLASIRKGQPISFTTPSVPAQIFKSKVSYIDPLLNKSSRTATVRAEINNRGNKLKPGMLVEGEITGVRADHTASGEAKSFVLPASAVLWTGDKSVVYVKLPNTEVPSYQFREVDVSSQSGGTVIVSSGLEHGDEVVTQGAFAIDAAAQLNNNLSMMNRDISIKKDADDKVPNYHSEAPEAFLQQLNAVADAYIDLKNAFVATDPAQAVIKASQLSDLYAQGDTTLLKGDARKYWNEQLDVLRSHTAMIIEGEDMEQQRKQFGFISEALINAITAFGTGGEALYIQHCPMALDNQGADWLATDREIENPYFGDKMMKCGTVKKTL